MNKAIKNTKSTIYLKVTHRKYLNLSSNVSVVNVFHCNPVYGLIPLKHAKNENKNHHINVFIISVLNIKRYAINILVALCSLS